MELKGFLKIMGFHKLLTDPDLHEPKGVALAPFGTVYFSDANGSGFWTSVGGLTGISLGGGQTGAQGATGPSGGPQGITGLQGVTGISGGDTGLPGPMGPQGVTGISGGGTGLPGATGAQGPIGIQGQTGIGYVGTDGATGAQGPIGLQGVTGISGGGTGLPGPMGPQGATGVSITGMQGIPGSTGLQGAQGQTGLGVTGPFGPAGSTGSPGVQGITGDQGLLGPTGYQGLTGPLGPSSTGQQGLTGIAGQQGLTGIQGAQGATGVGYVGTDGVTGAQGIQGATGVGYVGTDGVTGAQGIQGATGAASSVIGPAEDGDYTDGLFVDFVPTTPIGTAVDRFNEVLKSLAPAPAPALSDISIADTGIAGKISFGASNVIATYTNVPTKDINASIGTSESITDGADTVVLKGIFNASTIINGVLADATTVGPGTPTASYPADSFGDGLSGSVQLWLNGSQVAVVDLTSTPNAITDSNTSAILAVSAAVSNKFPNGTDFDVFKYRTGTWQINVAGQRNGYNRVEVRRVNGTTVVTNRFGWIVDANATATTFASESLSSLAMAGSKYLSGVQYHTSGTATYGITASNVHRNTYSSSGTAISHTGTRCSVASSSFANISTEADTEVISKTATVSTGSRILNQGITVSTTVDRTVQGDLTSSGTSSFSLLLDATAASSSSTTENADDEVYRIASNLNINTTAGYTSIGGSPSEWDSTISLVSATSGYSDGLLEENGTIKYPTQGTNGGNFSGIANGPAGNVNYSGATGNRVYLRFFYDAAPRQNFRLNATVTSTSFVSVATGPSGNNLTLEVLAPNTTSDGVSTVWKDATVSYTNDNSVGCYGSSFGSTIPTNWGMTIGGKTTSTSGNVVVIRITASSSWTGSINTLALTWL